MSAHSDASGLAIQMWPLASSVMPSGTRGRVVAQTRRLPSDPSPLMYGLTAFIAGVQDASVFVVALITQAIFGAAVAVRLKRTPL